MTGRLLTNLGIAAYLGALSLGIVVHALNLPGKVTLPGYFVVWDMFCAWTGYESRIHVIAEGESGTHYDLLAGQTGSPHLHGSLHRINYDYDGTCGPAVAKLAAACTSHEPLTQITIVEEVWSKQLNLSDAAYERYHGCPKQPRSYRSVRTVLRPDGSIAASQPPWFRLQQQAAVMANPVLAEQAVRGRDRYTVQR